MPGIIDGHIVALHAKFAAGEASKAAAKVAMGARNLVGSKLGDNDFWCGSFLDIV